MPLSIAPAAVPGGRGRANSPFRVSNWAGGGWYRPTEPRNVLQCDLKGLSNVQPGGSEFAARGSEILT